MVLHAFQGDVHQNQNFSIRVEQSVPARGVASILGLCASLIVTDLHTNLSREEVRMITMLRMNVSLMEYMCGEYDNLRSKIQASETRITKELRDKAEKQAREDSTMDET